MFKKVLPFILVSLFLFGMMPAGAQENTIVMWASYDLTDEGNPPSVTLNAAIEAFEAETGIMVEYEQVAWDQLSTKLATQAQSGGAMPDVVETSSQHVLALINTGALMNIGELLAGFDWIGELSAAESQACTVGGERYCVAADIRGGAWYYNVNAYPDGWPTTADAWLEAGAAVKEAGVYDYMATFFAGRHYSAVELTYSPWIYSNGGRLFDDDGLPAWASEETVEVVEFMRALLAEGYIPETTITGDFTAGEAPWVDGAAAAVRGGSWSYLFIPGLQDKYKAGETALGLAPSFNGGPNYVFLVGEGWGVGGGAANPDGAAAWFDFFMKPETLAEWTQHHGGIPTIESVFVGEAFEGEFYRATAENLAENGIFIERSTCYVQSLDKLSVVLQELMLDLEMDALSALEDAQTEMGRRCDPLY